MKIWLRQPLEAQSLSLSRKHNVSESFSNQTYFWIPFYFLFLTEYSFLKNRTSFSLLDPFTSYKLSRLVGLSDCVSIILQAASSLFRVREGRGTGLLVGVYKSYRAILREREREREREIGVGARKPPPPGLPGSGHHPTASSPRSATTSSCSRRTSWMTGQIDRNRRKIRLVIGSSPLLWASRSVSYSYITFEEHQSISL